MLRIPRKQYADMFGPTTGDQIRLADTNLWIEIEKDYTTYGDEVKFGGGKVIRDGMGQHPLAIEEETMDLVLTNAVIVDYTGIYKADVGIKNGRIAGIGKAGNDLLMDGVTMLIGATTDIIAAEGKIVTAGGIDAHIHFICVDQIETALHSGITTMIGGGTGPSTGTNATTCTPGSFYLHKMLKAVENFPMNFGLLGKGNASSEAPLIEQVKAGAIGLKLHEDWGTTPAAIDTSLRVADKYDIQIAIHSDTLNEAGFVEDTIRAIGGRVIHTYHTEGAGGGHAPERGPLAEETTDADNFRVKRYIAKYTINPAITHGISGEVGSIEVGKFADLVIWEPAFFGVKPEMILKGGMIAASIMGDPNASIPTPQPTLYRQMFAAYGKAVHDTSITFLSKEAIANELPKKLGLQKRVAAVTNIRQLRKSDLKLNNGTPTITVDPQTYEVFVDGELATCEPAEVLPMAQRYFLF